jgi:UDP-GlcNAc3NAcA epimerase
MQDAAIYYSQFSSEKSTIINQLKLEPSNYVLATIHRQENTDDIKILKKIIESFNKLHKECCRVVLPIHPRTKKIIENNNLSVNFTLIEPVGYFDMIELIKNSSLVITDSGGLQKEAFFFSKQCITIREQTEWVELVEGGFNTLVPFSKIEELATIFNKIKQKKSEFSVNLYGQGKASSFIVKELIKLS